MPKKTRTWDEIEQLKAQNSAVTMAQRLSPENLNKLRGMLDTLAKKHEATGPTKSDADRKA
jgi:hypothetical protein